MSDILTVEQVENRWNSEDPANCGETLAHVVDRLAASHENLRAEVERLTAEISSALDDPAEQRAQRYADEAADVSQRLIRAEQEVERLTAEVKALTTCDCGQPLGRGMCHICDNDE